MIDDLYVQLRNSLSDPARIATQTTLDNLLNSRQVMQDERARLTAQARDMAQEIDDLNSEGLPAYKPPSPNLPPYNPHSPGK